MRRKQPVSVDLIVQALPPVHDAIGEYTSCLAIELAKSVGIRVLTNAEMPCDAIDGVNIVPCFDRSGTNRFQPLTERLVETDAKAVIVQYNPFAWGQRGWAPDLVSSLWHFKERRPDTLLGIMFHETYTLGQGLRAWAMRQYQKRQYLRLVELSDFCMFSTECWAHAEMRRRPKAHVYHAPVGSNLPFGEADRERTRREFNLDRDDFVCGTFGGNHPSRMFSWIETAVTHISEAIGKHKRIVLLHVGESRDSWNLENSRIISTGRLSPQSAANAIAAMDLMINPFVDGISTRRGSAIASLQQGVPVLTTVGRHTDSLWQSIYNPAVFLSSLDHVDWLGSACRALESTLQSPRETRTAAREFFNTHFSWQVIAAELLHRLGSEGVTNSQPNEQQYVTA